MPHRAQATSSSFCADDSSTSDVLFQTSDTTWQAYNQYGGNSLYTGGPGANPGRAYKVSYNRPFTTRRTSAEDWLFNAEYPMVRWLEANGYDVSYFTGMDSDRHGAEIQQHKAFLSVGHDEYWSGQQRANVEAARNAGVNLAFFSGNEVFWKTRWENSIDSSNTAYRTLVSYKETHANAPIDPQDPPTWTGTWRDPRFSPPADGGRPENSLTGQLFTVNCCSYAMTVPSADGKMRFWRNTDIATLSSEQDATLPDGTIGYEWDEALDNGSQPAGLVRMSTTNVDVLQRLTDYGSTYAPGNATHHLTLYKHSSGALVFGAGTVQWSWGLDGNHDRGNNPPDPRMQQATVNLFADMGVQPATLQAGLVAATASTDTTAPASTISSPVNGAHVQSGSAVIISGTASDTGGTVGGVEMSVDGGATWHPANGRASWSYTWTPDSTGTATIKSRAVDDSGNIESPSAGNTVTVDPRACPCNIWSNADTPSQPYANDGPSIEVGVKFRSDIAGSITGLRFYKGAANTGTHTGHLWSSSGTQLAEAVFTGESASGWQEVAFAAPVAISANTTYVASYYSPSGGYAFTQSYFTSSTDNPPLHALADGTDGPNGVYKYSASGFPTDSFGASNYWVDGVFSTATGPDTTPPTVSAVSPPAGATGVNTNANLTATFSEAMDAATINQTTFQLRDAANSVVPAAVTYDAATRTATLDPSAALANAATYTATITSGSSGVTDNAGNPLAVDFTWTFTTAAPPPPPPDEGPGGPILVISSAANPFTRFYAEILRAEGLNEFTVSDIANVTPSVLSNYDVVVLGEMPLSAAQVTTFSDWVNAGGNLIAMRPDTQLASLLGLTTASGTLAEGYLKVNTASAPGQGIVGETIQFHGAADRYTLNGATSIAMLYSDATTATANPAVTLRSVGANGGQAAAFAYDLARSVVYTRQGNPAWAGQERDGHTPLRSDDLFYPDWINLDKVAIPQADEQQRLLANMITSMTMDKQPLPRFWYFPSGHKAVVVMTADGHPGDSAASRFDQELAASPSGCSVDDWECIRSTVYIYPNVPLTSAQANAYNAQGFEIGLHVNTNCQNWTPSSLEGFYSDQLATLAATFPGIPAPVSNRTHCIVWSDYATQPQVELNHGMRLDTNYYYWPPEWVNDRPGMFTGSGMPMRFATADGALIDVYQATTQMTDESGQTYPKTINALLDKALGPEGYYGAFTANIHVDGSSESLAQTIIDSAKSRGVPVVSSRQMLAWLDGRNGSSFGSLGWNGNNLSFTIAVGTGARNLQAMVPATTPAGALTGITKGGAPVSYTTQTIKGVSYAFFSASAGSYQASYAADSTPPTISALSASSSSGGSATITWNTDEPANSRVEYGTSPTTLTSSASDATLVTSHSLALSGLASNTTYYYRVVSQDAANNTATSPTQSFTSALSILVDDTVADFSAGTPGANTYVSEMQNGEVILSPTVGVEFGGNALPAGWSSTAWNAGGGASVMSGTLTVDGARAGTDAVYAPGRSLEFVATFGAAPFQHMGFGVTYDTPDLRWAMFSTYNTSDSLYVRTNVDPNDATNETRTLIPGNWLGTPHRYRIDWNAGSVVYSIDGVQVAAHAVSPAGDLRPLASDYNTGGASLSIDWAHMSPYAATGTFQSRVFDAGTAVNWDALTWTSTLTTGTDLALSVRTGDTPTPDASWSAFTPVSTSGGAIGQSSRYIQYKADLSTSNSAVTPVLERVEISYADIPANQPPVLAAIGNKTVIAGVKLSFTATASDPDVPANTLTFSLENAPAGATINAASGVFTWTPTEAQVGAHTFDVCVSDGALADCETITVTVTASASNAAPVLGAIGNKTVDELTELTFTATATDPDVPAQQLTFSLANGTNGQVPAGASIDPVSGVFTWTPTEAQGPGAYTFDVCVSDGALSDCETITVTVHEVNQLPVLGAIGNKTVTAGAQLSFTATASDPDVPANTLTFSLENAPAGAAINAVSGVFTWTPTEAQVGAHTFTVKVCDNGNPVRCDQEQITVTVQTAQQPNPPVRLWLPMIIR